MPVILDTAMLTLVLKPEAPPPLDPNTGAPVTEAHARIAGLLEQLSDENLRILIPAGVWTEFLATAGDKAEALAARVKHRGAFEVVPFDEVAAVEAAIDLRNALRDDDRTTTFVGSTQSIATDRQIAAIGKIRNVTIYAASSDLVKIGQTMDVKVMPLWDLPVSAASADAPAADAPAAADTTVRTAIDHAASASLPISSTVPVTAATEVATPAGQPVEPLTEEEILDLSPTVRILRGAIRVVDPEPMLPDSSGPAAVTPPQPKK